MPENLHVKPLAHRDWNTSIFNIPEFFIFLVVQNHVVSMNIPIQLAFFLVDIQRQPVISGRFEFRERHPAIIAQRRGDVAGKLDRVLDIKILYLSTVRIDDKRILSVFVLFLPDYLMQRSGWLAILASDGFNSIFDVFSYIFVIIYN